MLKEYVALEDFSLSTVVLVDGNERRIRFSGGCMKPRQNGTFTTDDKVLQDAIEGSPVFGRSIGLSKTWDRRDVEVDVVPVDGDGLEVRVCGTVNEAVGWLMELGCKKSEVNSSAKSVAVARSLGYELRFEKEE